MTDTLGVSIEILLVYSLARVCAEKKSLSLHARTAYPIFIGGLYVAPLQCRLSVAKSEDLPLEVSTATSGSEVNLNACSEIPPEDLCSLDCPRYNAQLSLHNRASHDH